MTIALHESPRASIPAHRQRGLRKHSLLALGALGLAPLAALGLIAFQLARTSEVPSTIAAGTLEQAPLSSAPLPLYDAPWLAAVGKAADDPITRFVASRGIAPATIDYRIAPGDTLLSVLSDHRVRGEDAQALIAALRAAGLASELKMRPRQALTLSLGGAVTKRDPRPLLSASLRLDAETRVDVARDTTGTYGVKRARIELQRREVLARGIITQSLAANAADAGVSYGLIAKFADIYAFDVDFQRDIKTNDTFEVYYTQYVAPDGEIDPAKGEILFSRLSYNGKVKGFYRHAAADGTADYYDENGKSARTFLMRTPVEGARISSSFGMRKHPILGFTRMHKGVDFAAPVGTKIFAAGAGVVELAARNGSFGNYVRIRHDSGYKTAYAHLSRYAAGIRSGTRVTQGQVVGYVGMTGTTNGPHLHYEVLQANAQINPMSVKVPTGRKLAGSELDRFHREVARIALALKANPTGQFAFNGGTGWGAR